MAPPNPEQLRAAVHLAGPRGRWAAYNRPDVPWGRPLRPPLAAEAAYARSPARPVLTGADPMRHRYGGRGVSADKVRVLSRGA